QDCGFAFCAAYCKRSKTRLELRIAIVELLDHRFKVSNGSWVDILVVENAGKRDHSNKRPCWRTAGIQQQWIGFAHGVAGFGLPRNFDFGIMKNDACLGSFGTKLRKCLV